ncbi:hypothetical protein H4R26_005765, partial [Coemansia thaxteri]
MLDLVTPSTLGGLAVLGVVGYYSYRRYVGGCRVRLVTSDAKTSLVVRQTTEEGIVTLHDALYDECP